MSHTCRVYWLGEDGESHDLPLDDTDPLPSVGDVISLPGELLHQVVRVDAANEPNTFELEVEPVEQA